MNFALNMGGMRFAAGAALSLALAAGAARAEVVHYAASLSGAQESPATDSAGKGSLSADLDTATRTLTYKVTYSGLTGPAVAAHFHGPAAPGANAGVMVPVTDLSDPMTGSATLTDEQISGLKAGAWYFNIHTKAHPGGEIRGQVHAAD